jgi:hypothetical protein
MEGLAGTPAELVFPTLNVTYQADIVDSNLSGLLIRPSRTAGEVDDSLSRLLRAPLWMRVVSGRETYRVGCAVQGLCDPLILVTCTSTPQRLPRRDRERLACSLSVVYRAVRERSGSSAWQEAFATDINLTGVQLRIHGQRSFPTRVELQIPVPYLPANETVTRAAIADGSNSYVLKVTGQARHGRFTPEGETVVGVKFEHLAPASHLQLGGYLERLAGSVW